MIRNMTETTMISATEFIQMPADEIRRVNWFFRNCYVKFNEKTKKYRWEHMEPNRMLAILRSWTPFFSEKNRDEADEIKIKLIKRIKELNK